MLYGRWRISHCDGYYIKFEFNDTLIYYYEKRFLSKDGIVGLYISTYHTFMSKIHNVCKSYTIIFINYNKQLTLLLFV